MSRRVLELPELARVADRLADRRSLPLDTGILLNLDIAASAPGSCVCAPSLAAAPH